MTLVETAPLVPPAELGRVHIMGIGGAGMSGIAHILLARDFAVSGCDAGDSAVLARLRDAGATVAVGHDPGHVSGVDTLVVSSAVRADHPEVTAASSGGVRVLPRAGALASVMADRRGIAVSGTHGKTTTTSMLVTALTHCGEELSYLIGGTPTAGSPAARNGEGEFFVAEADESDGSFLQLTPHAAVVTNVEADHLDNYGTPEAVHDAFARFLDRILPGGFLVCSADDTGARRLAGLAVERGIEVHTYGESPDAGLRVEGFESRGLGCDVDLVADTGPLGRLTLGVPGRHNALNAAAVVATGLRLGFDFADLAEGLAGFTPVARRFELKGEARGVRVFDSYAHHPTEIAADLRTARTVAAGGRVIAAFQPHLFSRTRFFAGEFGRALGLADDVVVLDVYAAREEPEPGITGEIVAAAVPLAADRVRFEPDFDAVPALLAGSAAPGDVVLTLGAGDVTALGPRLVELLRAGASGEEDTG